MDPVDSALEARALRRDKRFLVRLVLAVGVGVVAGGVLYGELTSDKLAGCVAGSMEGAAGTPK